MHWPTYVKTKFYKCVSDYDGEDDLKASLQNHERTTTFVDNLSEEISRAERLVSRRRGRPLRLDTIDSLIEDMVKILIRGIEAEAIKRRESALSKSAREADEQYQKDLDATVDGNPSGDFQDLEIVEVEDGRTPDQIPKSVSSKGLS